MGRARMIEEAWAFDRCFFFYHFSFDSSVNIRILGSKWRLSKEGTLALIAAKGLSLFRNTGSLPFGWLAYFGAVSSNVVCENPMALGVGQTPSPPRPRLTGYCLRLVSLPCKIISTSLRLRLSNSYRLLLLGRNRMVSSRMTLNCTCREADQMSWISRTLNQYFADMKGGILGAACSAFD